MFCFRSPGGRRFFVVWCVFAASVVERLWVTSVCQDWRAQDSDCPSGRSGKKDSDGDADEWQKEERRAKAQGTGTGSHLLLLLFSSPPLHACLSPRGHSGSYSEERRSDQRGWPWKGRTDQKTKRRGKGQRVAGRVSCPDEVTLALEVTGSLFRAIWMKRGTLCDRF